MNWDQYKQVSQTVCATATILYLLVMIYSTALSTTSLLVVPPVNSPGINSSTMAICVGGRLGIAPHFLLDSIRPFGKQGLQIHFWIKRQLLQSPIDYVIAIYSFWAINKNYICKGSPMTTQFGINKRWVNVSN